MRLDDRILTVMFLGGGVDGLRMGRSGFRRSGTGGVLMAAVSFVLSYL